MRIPIAIVGNGGAAAEAVLALRSSGYRGDIHLFADNDHAPYNPMLGSYLVAGKLPVERTFPFGNGISFYQTNGVTTHLGAPVARLDAHEQELSTAAGETYGYERCLIATGARPAVPPIAGLREALGARGAVDMRETPGRVGESAGEGRRVFTLQTLDDALALRHAVEEVLGVARESGVQAPGGELGEPTAAGRPRAAVVGASFAGVKIAAVLHDLGFAVTLVERETSILPLAAHPEAARIMEAHLLSEGYELRLGAALAGVQSQAARATSGHTPRGRMRLDFGALPGASDPGGAGGTACEESAAQEEVDLVVVCTGNRPALGFLAPGQVDVGVGILVDEQMRSSVPTLYAAGDVAQGKNLLSGRHEIIGLWSSARYQGRAAGRGLAGAPSGHPGGVPHNITHVGRMLFASVGCVDDYDDVTVSHEDGYWQLRLWREGRVVGVNLLNSCLSAGITRQALTRAAAGASADTEATWTSFNS